VTAPTPTPRATPAPTRRRDKRETQERLIQAAVGLFAERGYEGTSVAAIAAGAGVSTSAAFWHFGDKEGLFREAFHRMLKPFNELLDAELAQGEAPERVRTLIELYQSTVAEHGAMIRTLVRWLIDSEIAASLLLVPLFQLHARFESEIAAAFAEIGYAEPSATEQARAIVAGLDGVLVLSMMKPGVEDQEVRLAGIGRLVETVLEGPDGA